MKKVARVSKPKSLVDNSVSWTKDLLDEITKQGTYTKVGDKYKNKYNQVDVKKTLKAMYLGKCCYCEKGIGTESYEHIEHLKPKANSQFHHLAFDWDNLHWACQICNMSKGEDWNDCEPILDPTVDDPDNFLEIDIATAEVKNKNLRGLTTIKHADLNRDGLIKARKKVSNSIIELITCIVETESENDRERYKRILSSYLEEDSDFTSYSVKIVKHFL